MTSAERPGPHSDACDGSLLVNCSSCDASFCCASAFELQSSAHKAFCNAYNLCRSLVRELERVLSPQATGCRGVFKNVCMLLGEDYVTSRNNRFCRFEESPLDEDTRTRWNQTELSSVHNNLGSHKRTDPPILVSIGFLNPSDDKNSVEHQFVLLSDGLHCAIMDAFSFRDGSAVRGPTISSCDWRKLLSDLRTLVESSEWDDKVEKTYLTAFRISSIPRERKPANYGPLLDTDCERFNEKIAKKWLEFVKRQPSAT